MKKNANFQTFIIYQLKTLNIYLLKYIIGICIKELF